MQGCTIIGSSPRFQDYIEDDQRTELSNVSRSFVERMRVSIDVPLWIKAEMQKTAY